MLLNLFPRQSPSGFEEVRLRHQAEAQVARLESQLEAVLDSYIGQLGSGQYRVILPSGRIELTDNRQSARDLIMAEAS